MEKILNGEGLDEVIDNLILKQRLEQFENE